MLLALSVVLIGMVLWWGWQRGSRFKRMMLKFPGPRPYPLVGNALQMGTNTVDFTRYIERSCKKYFGTPFAIWIGSQVYVLLTEPNDIEKILSSNTLLDKGSNYDYTHPWLGGGLLTSTGSKWRKHRKILTPTFHFKILEEFMEVFNANGAILIEKLQKEVGGPGFDIHKYMSLYTLDIISDSAMGVKINAQSESQSEYVKAVKDMNDIIVYRSTLPWLASDFIFNLSRYKRIQDEALKILHATTNSVIKTRQEEIRIEKLNSKIVKNEDDGVGVKKRLAFLDMLIESTFNGSELTDEDIREEVDTFMFEGHDTSSSAISFAIWLLSWNADVQDRVFQELKEVFPDPGEPVTFRGLQELKYMERVIKETLRLYPSVPMYVRELTEEVAFSDNLVAQKNANITVTAFMTHRNPVFFPDPDKFDPDRFLPENVQGRHPYAYIPFSAGPRNCIGQKFAMQEMKSSLAHILRAYKAVPGTEKPDLVLACEVVLMSKTGITVKIIPRV